MASPRPQGRVPHEDTPLLQQDSSDSETEQSRRQQRYGDDIDGSPHASNGGVQSPRPRLARIDRAMLIQFAIVLACSIISLALLAASFAMGDYGSNQFGYYNYSLMEFSAPAFWTVLICLIVAFANVLHLRFKRHPLPAVINILVFGVAAIIFVPNCIMTIITQISDPEGYCSKDLDDPDSWYSRSYAECLEWAAKFKVIFWLFFAFTLITSLLYIATLVTSLVKVYKERSRTPSGSRWIIPAGGISVEVAIRWGSQQRQNEEARGETA